MKSLFKGAAMNKAIVFLLLLSNFGLAATKISQLPLGTASTTTSIDIYPFVNMSSGTTEKMTVWDIANIPAIVSTYAPLANPTFTGNMSAGTITSGVWNGTAIRETYGGTGISSTATFPSSGTIVTEAASETLTNKVLSGNTAATLINGSGTLTLNTTGNATVPNAIDTLVGQATTDTLTNKTISTGGTNVIGSTTITGTTGTGSLVFASSPTLVTPALGTPSALVGTNITGTATSFTASNVTTNANLTGDVTSVGNASTVAKIQGTSVSGTTGSGNVVFSSSPTLVTPALGTPSALVGTNISGTASGLTAGNVTTNANLTGPITSSGNATSVASQTGTGSTFVMNTSPTLVTPNLGTPSALVGTNITGTATSFTASNVTTNANLTGVITSVGNATSTGAQTGTGNTFAMSASPTFTGTVGAAAVTASSFTINGSTSGAITFLPQAIAGTYNFNPPTTVGAAGQLLAQGATPGTSAMVWVNPAAAIPLTTLGDTMYENSSPALARLAGNTSATLAVMTQTGNGTISAAPVWTTSTGTGNAVFSNSPTLVTPALGTPSALVGTNITGTASSFTASNVTTNANLTGPITSSGNTTSIASKTGTGTTFAMSASPTFTGTVGAAAITATGLITGDQLTITVPATSDAAIATFSSFSNGSLYVGQDNITGGTFNLGNNADVIVTDTNKLVLATVNHAGLTLDTSNPPVGTFAGPLTVTGQLTSSVTTGTAPFVVSSTTQVANLNAATAGTVTTNANLTGDVTSVGNATTLASTAVSAGSYTNTNLTVDAKGRITAASNGSGTNPSIGSFGSTPNANGASASGSTITMQPADASHPGEVSTTTQSFEGNKTFTGSVAANSLSLTTALPASSGGTGEITTQAAMNNLVTWAPSTTYVSGDLVSYGKNLYTCLATHSSGTFETDYASGYWQLASQPAVEQNLMGVGSNFEDGTANGWTAVGTPTITNGLPVSVGSGGAVFSTSNGGQAVGANTSAAAVTLSGPINGKFSLSLATSGAGTIGDGYISQSIPISIAFQAKALTLKFKYKVASGTPNMSGTSSNTYAAAVYDVTNNAWLGLAGGFNFVQSSGVGEYLGSFQTATNTANIQVFVYSPVAPTGASSLLLDEFFVGQIAATNGPAMSDWTSYTPTGGWTSNVTYLGKYRRVGDSLEVTANAAVTGTLNAATFTINLPSGFIIDTTKLAGSNYISVGDAIALVSGTSWYNGSVAYNTTTSVQVFSDVSTGSWSNTIPGTFGNNSFATVHFTVPIAGWSSNSSMSSDTDTRVISASYYASTNHSVSSSLPANFDTQITDTSGSVTTGSAWKFTTPVSGNYSFSLLMNVSGAPGTISVYKNGSDYQDLTNTSATFPNISGTIKLNAGDYIDFRPNNSVTLNGTSLGNGSVASAVWIYRLSGPAVISATESVNGRFYAATGSISSSYSAITFSTKDYDTHAAYSGSTLTIPVSGKYHFHANVATSGTYTVGQINNIAIFKNTVQVDEDTSPAGGSQGTLYSILDDTINCLAGDQIVVELATNSSSPTVQTSNNRNYFTWTRVGN